MLQDLPVRFRTVNALSESDGLVSLDNGYYGIGFIERLNFSFAVVMTFSRLQPESEKVPVGTSVVV
jgi:hypothetical protein